MGVLAVPGFFYSTLLGLLKTEREIFHEEYELHVWGRLSLTEVRSMDDREREHWWRQITKDMKDRPYIWGLYSK